MSKFKLGDFVHVNGYGDGHVVLVDLPVDTFRDDEYRGIGVVFERTGDMVVVPTSRVSAGIRPYLYALRAKMQGVTRIVDGRVYISLEEVEQAQEQFKEDYGRNADVVEIEAVLPWKKRD